METEKLLSRRQSEVLPLLVMGFSNKQIARELHIAEGTVKIHLAGAFGKLGVHNRTEAAVRGSARTFAEPVRPGRRPPFFRPARVVTAEGGGCDSCEGCSLLD